MSANKASVRRISCIAVRGFKSIHREQAVNIRPLTILAGANSAGKSSIMQPLLLLKQTLETAGDPGALLLDGPNVRFSKAEQLLNGSPGKKSTNEFAVRLSLLEDTSIELVFRREQGYGFDLHTMLYREGQTTRSIESTMSQEAIVNVLPPQLAPIEKVIHKQETGPLHWVVRRERCFFVFDLVSKDKAKAWMFGAYNVPPSQLFVPHIQGVIHLPGLRGNPQRTYPRTAGGPVFRGTFEPYAASVIAQWQGNGGKEQLNNLAAALESMGLTWKVKAEPVDDTQVELKVGRLPHSRRGGANDLISIADVGFGVSQALPVVVALLVARPGQLVYLEQPEIHLHPLAQRKLAGVLRDAVARGIVAVVETHSALLLREIQTLVATGRLAKEDVALHWFQRGADGATTVTEAELDDNGAYGNWPEDFDITELQAEKEYLDAVETKGAGA